MSNRDNAHSADPFRPGGDLTGEAGASFREALATAVAAADGGVLRLVLEEVGEMDAETFAALCTAAAQAELEVAGATEEVRALLEPATFGEGARIRLRGATDGERDGEAGA